MFLDNDSLAQQVEWCGGSETMEEILSRIQQREEAAVKRERAMAYAFSHQVGKLQEFIFCLYLQALWAFTP